MGVNWDYESVLWLRFPSQLFNFFRLTPIPSDETNSYPRHRLLIDSRLQFIEAHTLPYSKLTHFSMATHGVLQGVIQRLILGVQTA